MVVLHREDGSIMSAPSLAVPFGGVSSGGVLKSARGNSGDDRANGLDGSSSHRDDDDDPEREGNFDKDADFALLRRRSNRIVRYQRLFLAFVLTCGVVLAPAAFIIGSHTHPQIMSLTGDKKDGPSNGQETSNSSDRTCPKPTSVTINGTTYYLEDGTADISVNFTSSSQQHQPSSNDKKVGMIFSIVVGAIFAAILLAFRYYTRMVDQRHFFVVCMVKKSRKIVDSLFPSNVRDRLLNGDNRNDSSSNAGDLLFQSTNSGSALDAFTSSGALPRTAKGKIDYEMLTRMNTLANSNWAVNAAPPGAGAVPMAGSAMPARSPLAMRSSIMAFPVNVRANTMGDDKIADKYPSTTVCFADIAGFTSWSSKFAFSIV
jgi:hypothetical protein